MDGTIAARSQANPVFILPAALNACAEDAGRAVVERLLRLPASGAPGPVVVIDGDGMTDLRESISEHMQGRGTPVPGGAPDLGLPAQHYNVIGEGRAPAAPLFVEIDDTGAAGVPLPQPVAGRLGILIRCRDAKEMLSVAARYAGAAAAYVQAADDDAPLAELLRALLAPGGVRLTVSPLPPAL
ncbi:hypothetical protein FHW58_000569 [Duganella sp. 1224]|uniref:hypothetical protein n=1 Tax=Duganella sp. 1224 TaxID=2587052 RepID=UPI0015CA1E0A|nr:hypothetical protein [Duganella sp. 1224]NYE59417.1 hypothetical protein [Duganella sp. 1224]